MQIDLFTVVVQVVNFLILIVLLRAVLYKPVIRAMDERERKIADQLQAAAQKDEDARRQLEALQQERRELERQREALVDEMKTEVDAKRDEALEQVRREADELRNRWQTTVEREKAAFLQTLRQRVNEQVFEIARRALNDLGNVDLERQIVMVFVERLKALDEEERGLLQEDLTRSDGRVLIHSAFGLPQEAREQVADAIHHALGDGVSPVFETAPDLISGIELRVHGRVIRWSLENYLSAIETHLQSELEQSV